MNSIRTRLPLVAFLLSVVIFGAITIYAYNGHGRLFLRASLPFEYIVLALAAAWYWKSGSHEATCFPALQQVALSCAAAACLISAGISFCMQPSTMLSDEDSYRFQGRIYASGRLFADPLPGAAIKNQENPRYLYFEQHVLSPTRWYSKYPPGWPLGLALGDLLHAEWLINPVLGVLLLYLSGQIALAFFDPQIRWLTILLMAVSPYFFTQAYTELSHMLSAVLTAGATLLMIRWIQREKVVFLVAAVICIGYNFLVRPYTALAVAGVLCGGLLFHHRSQRSMLTVDLLVMSAGGAVAVAAFLGYQYLYSGGPFLSPYAVFEGRTRPGELALGSSTLIQGFIRLRTQFQATLSGLFPCFAWMLVAGILNKSGKRPKLPAFARAVILLCPLTILFYLVAPVESFGPNGERYYFEAYFCIAILAARGVEELMLRWQVPGQRVLVVVLALIAVMLPIIGCSTLNPVTHTLPYERMARAVRPLSMPGSIVFMSSSPSFQAHFFNINAADWRHAPVVFLGDPGQASRERVVRQFGRSHWWVAHYDEQSQQAVVTQGGVLPGPAPVLLPSR
jgi:hypothetical protein